MTECPNCELTSGLYRDHFRGLLQCDNCGWCEGKPEPEAAS